MRRCRLVAGNGNTRTGRHVVQTNQTKESNDGPRCCVREQKTVSVTLLTLPLPPSANRYWRVGRNHAYVSAEARSYKTAVRAILWQAGVRPQLGPVSVTIRVYRKRHAGDLDNFLKVTLDALQGAAFENDSQVTQIVASLESVDKAHPRVEVIVAQAVQT
jgi:crossover junction endodeoxyribonuclease RusA